MIYFVIKSSVQICIEELTAVACDEGGGGED